MSAHLIGNMALAGELLRLADMPVIRDWTESIWGADSPYVVYRAVPAAPPKANPEQVIGRMPRPDVKGALRERDGYHCRFCGIPVIRSEVRKRIRSAYPDAVPWGRSNAEQHAAFQAMWLQYDHLLPYGRGGTTDLANLLITCAPCNFGRMEHTLEEVGLIDPTTRQTVRSSWDGLERFA